MKIPFYLARNLGLLAFLTLSTLLSPLAMAQDSTDDLPERLATAAQEFLDSLKGDAKRHAMMEFANSAREDWQFIPKVRAGIPLKELDDEQRALAKNLLEVSLSEKGLVKAEQIMALESVLRQLEGADHRDPELYYLAFFGQPAATGTWGWRYEGHHLSLNFTVVEGKVVVPVPAFFGANPAEVRSGPHKGTRALAKEEDLARKLVQSLDKAQLKQARFEETALKEIVSAAERGSRSFDPVGIAYSKLSADQQDTLMTLVSEYIEAMPEKIAETRLAAIKDSDLSELRFGWAGSTERGEKHYYRVQGETFVIEYTNFQNDGNHIHTVWRDFDGDFGRDLLKEHFENHAE